MDKADPSCRCMHHAIVPAAIVLIGLSFLANVFGLLSDGLLSIVWPALLVIAGVVKLSGRGCRCCKARA